LVRHQPDIAVIQEIRDAETGEALIGIFNTAVRVIASLHTNSDAHIPDRLEYFTEAQEVPSFITVPYRALLPAAYTTVGVLRRTPGLRRNSASTLTAAPGNAAGCTREHGRWCAQNNVTN
jgi:hypothetical protein